MTTNADLTTRVRTEMHSIFQAYQALERRVTDLSDEVTANGGAVGIYGKDGVDFPEQGDGFSYADMVNALTNLPKLMAESSLAEKQTIIRTRRD